MAKLDKFFQSIREKNKDHLDIISRARPTFSEVFFTKILCVPNLLTFFFPLINKANADFLKEIIKIWMAFKTRISSLERINRLLKKKEKFDIVSLMREILSPREEIYKKKEWLSF